MKNVNIYLVAFALLGVLTFSACGDDDDSGPTISSQIGTALEGTWTVSTPDPGNPDDYYDNMSLVFGTFTEGTGGSLSVSGINDDLISDFGTQYNIAGMPSSISLFSLTLGGNIGEATVSGDPTAGPLVITFSNQDGATIGRSTGVGEYTLTITKQ
ncbi:MAG: hypothetical protein AAF843_21410 [Bacteroidota bacterium]